ncbi:MAG TPA: hypothetical protein DEH78_32930 [Solibacterales bacterium]|nr:hypothetical protein [Bryobacterales bacterium]
MPEFRALESFLALQKQAAELEAQAKKEMEERFKGLLDEAASLSHLYRKTFGGKLALPKSVKGFHAAVPGRGGASAKPAKKAAAAPPQPSEAPAAPVDNRKAAILKRNLAAWKEKLQSADEAEKRKLQDKIYMAEDELRLMGAAK